MMHCENIYVKEKKPDRKVPIRSFYLYEISRIGKSRDRKQIGGFQGMGGRRNGK